MHTHLEASQVSFLLGKAGGLVGKEGPRLIIRLIL